MMVKTAILMACIFLIPKTASPSESRPAGNTYALIVNGSGKDSADRAMRDRVVNDFRAYLLEKAVVKPDRLIVLLPGASTAAGVRTAIHTIASTATPSDRFILYYIGQANAVGETLRFNLPGPDMTQADLASWLADVRAGTQLVVLDCPRAAMAAKALSRPGRVLLLASTEEQAYAPRFGLHFVPALSRPESDTNRDGRVSVLEAFTAAAREIEQWYRKRKLLPTETPLLDDNGDGRPSERPWRYEQDGGDGRLAAGLFLAPGL